MILVSNWPARPTNGIPCSSSSAPGASPTNIRSASGLPTPNTTCFRPSVCSLQRVQSPMSSRIETSASIAFLENVTGCADCTIGVLGVRPGSDPGLTLPSSVSAARARQAGARVTPATPKPAGEPEMFGDLIAVHGRRLIQAALDTRGDRVLRIEREKFFDPVQDLRGDTRL